MVKIPLYMQPIGANDEIGMNGITVFQSYCSILEVAFEHSASEMKLNGRSITCADTANSFNNNSREYLNFDVRDRATASDAFAGLGIEDHKLKSHHSLSMESPPVIEDSHRVEWDRNPSAYFGFDSRGLENLAQDQRRVVMCFKLVHASTIWPFLRSAIAAANPPIPAPTTDTFKGKGNSSWGAVMEEPGE
ncbi:hypothetical protein B0H17DRAFT_1149733 [Mycena rosella]|uniref:Uncharacterized protein n=1 Tax=Mycena rosella TaxID=1033263 RepID=A0AAD7BYB3_MYCRO|nr:hypothetical protein B0H17DRAFT_1149733 [Mycena rosella]